MLAAGLEEEKTVVIIGDDVLHHPKILHLIHCILTTGYAAGVFTLEDSYNLIEVRRYNANLLLFNFT